MTSYVKDITATRIHGRFDLEQTFQPGINILHGRNGTGKTTLLHILANVLNGDFNRFAFLNFDEISVGIAYTEKLFGTRVHLKRESSKEDRIIVNIDENVYGEPILVDQVRKTEREFSRDFGRRDRFGPWRTIKPLLPTAYFPAFRTMIEAWSSSQENNVRQYKDYILETRSIRANFFDPRDISTTMFSRDLFGYFVPRVSYPSPIEIEQRIEEEVKQSMLQIGRTDRQLFTSVFLDVVRTISQRGEQPNEPPEKIVKEISDLTNELADYPTQGEVDRKVYPQLSAYLKSFEMSQGGEEDLVVRVLDVYRRSLRERVEVQKKAFIPIERYLESVNRFLEGKKLILSYPEGPRVSKLRIHFEDGGISNIRALSSGERQIITLIYAATHMNEQQIVLIDEPEISLHVDWQRNLLESMAEQLGGRQIIACTHSPTIGADYESRMFELILTPTTHLLESIDDISNDQSSEEMESDL